MAINFVPEYFEDLVVRQMPQYGSLFSNGLVFTDPSPEFQKGGNFLKSRYLNSLSFMGDDNIRASSGDITAKTLSYGEATGVICRRYDAITQTDLDVLVSGVDGIKELTPQIAESATKAIEIRYASILNGLFRNDGALQATHEYNYTGLGTGGKMDSSTIIVGQALMGKDSAKLDKLIVHSNVYVNLVLLGLVTFANTTVAQTVATTGQVPNVLGKRVIIDDNLCAGINTTATGTAVLSSDTVGSVTITNNGGYYLTAPTVTFSGGGGSGAAGTAVIENGEVVSITITNAGSSYETVPTVTIAAPASTIYPSYLMGGRPFYFAQQRDMGMKLIENLTAQNITQTLRWNQDYCPHVINTNYTGSANPTNAVLETASSWTNIAANVSDIPIVRLLNKI